MNKVCLIAGSGDLPKAFIENATRAGVDVFTVGVRGITSVKSDETLSLGNVKRLINLLEKKGIKDIVMLGKFEHKLIYTHLLSLDDLALSILKKAKNKKPQTIVKSFMEELESQGFNFVDPSPYLRSLLVEKGNIASVEPSEEIMEDALFGYPLAVEIASMDIGQTIVVKDKAVVSVEAMEGTQEAIKRAGQVAGSGCVVIKVARKNQDPRIDVPTVGLNTLELIKKIRGKALFIEAQRVYVLDKEKMIRFANAHSIVFYAL